MSENKSEEGYVIEGNTDIATKGHLVIYSVKGGRVGYSSFAEEARRLGLSQAFVPPIRSLKNAFAVARRNLIGLSLPSLEMVEGWDGVVDRELNVVSLRKGNEYAVQIKSTGRSRGKNHVTTQNVMRLEFSPEDSFEPEVWREQYLAAAWEGRESLEAWNEAERTGEIRQCIAVTPYWEEDQLDPILYGRVVGILMQEFTDVATSIDQKMLRDKIVNVLQNELGALPFRSGAGAFFVPNLGEESEGYLATLENYSRLLESFGNANAIEGNPQDSNWFDEHGRPRNWHQPRTNLRIMGYIDNERQMSYLRRDIEMNLGREIATYQQKLMEVAEGFNEDNVAAFEARLETTRGLRASLAQRLNNLSRVVGGDLNVQVEPFADVSASINSRAAQISSVNSSVANRLLSLTLINE